MLSHYLLRPLPVLSQFAGDSGELIQAVGGYEGADFGPGFAGEEGVWGGEVRALLLVVSGVEKVAGAGGSLFSEGEVCVPPGG
jgi:hypothetical protein